MSTNKIKICRYILGLFIIATLLVACSPAHAVDFDLFKRASVGIAAEGDHVNGNGVIIGIDPQEGKDASLVWILTCKHLLRKNTSVKVKFHDSLMFPATVMETDQMFDLALLVCLAKNEFIPTIAKLEIEKGTNELKLGQQMYMYTKLAYLRDIMWSGPVASLIKKDSRVDVCPVFFVVQTPAYPGVSGSPVVDEDTRLRGLVFGVLILDTSHGAYIPPAAMVVPSPLISAWLDYLANKQAEGAELGTITPKEAAEPSNINSVVSPEVQKGVVDVHNKVYDVKKRVAHMQKLLNQINQAVRSLNIPK